MSQSDPLLLRRKRSCEDGLREISPHFKMPIGFFQHGYVVEGVEIAEGKAGIG